MLVTFDIYHIIVIIIKEVNGSEGIHYFFR